jgi:hypothetical protein
MKKMFLALAGAAVLSGSIALATETATAAPPHRVCRVITTKRVYWINHKRHVVYRKSRVCHWVRH